MKPKKLLVTLLVASSILTACNSGSPQEGSAAQVNQKTTQAAEKKNPFIEFATKGLIEGFTNPFALPGKFFSEWVLGWLFPEKDKTMDKLKEMDKKLDDIIVTLGNSIGIGTDTLNTIDEFYKNQMHDNLRQSLALMNDDTDAIDGKFIPYVNKKAFGEVTANDMEGLYQVAKNNCDNDGIYDALNATDITPNYQSKRGLQSTLSSDSLVDNLFIDFTKRYASNKNKGDDGKFYTALAANQQIYLGTILNAMHPGDDLMNYINNYNYNNILYTKKLLASFQDLYTMQVAQLAYRNACYAKIRFLNVDLPSIPKGKLGGLEGFNADIEILNTEYNKAYTQLESNIKTYLAPIDNKQLYSFVNNYVQSTGESLLSDKSFNTNESTPGSCSLTHLRVDYSKTDVNGVGSGIAKLVASCITANTPQGIESRPIALEIPYSMTGNTINGVGMSNIGFDPQTKKMLVKFNLDSSKIGAGNILNLDKSQDFSNLSDLSNLNTLGMSRWNHYTNSSDVYQWSSGVIDTADGDNGDGVELFKAHGDTGSSNMSDVIKEVLPTNVLSNDDDKINYDSKDMSKYHLVYEDGGYSDLFIGTYNGRIFAVRVDTLHSDERPWDQYSYPGNGNMAIKRVVGIGCLTNECTRINSESLKWRDGTEVRINRQSNNWSNIEIVGGTDGSLMRPVGAYQEMCRQLNFMNGTLVADCFVGGDRYVNSTLHYSAECQADSSVDFVNQQLVCHDKKK